MTIEEFATCCFAFRDAFEHAEKPGWEQVKRLDGAAVLRAIAGVKASSLHRFNRDKAGLVIRAATPRRKRSRRSRPKYPRMEAAR